MMRTPFLVFIRLARLRMFLVCSVSGVWTVMKSALASTWSSVAFSTPSSWARWSDRKGS